MRETKFRGIRKEYNKDIHESEFMYGNLLNECSIGEVGIGLDSYCYAEVLPETVGQFTGLKDKTGVCIYEGDIILPDYNGLLEFEVEYTNGKFNICGYSIDNLIVTGNIHQKK